jgi:hypothetical protein
MKLLLLIPSYNTGRLLADTVAHALEHWPEVWVVLDGSTDGSEKAVEALQPAHPGLRLIKQPVNRGKGAAICAWCRGGRRRRLHACADDGCRRPASARVDPEVHRARPGAPGGRPARPADLRPRGPACCACAAAASRTRGRRSKRSAGASATRSSACACIPCRRCCARFAAPWFARRFDFDTEVAVRICWQGVPAINVPTHVRYLTAAEGGVSSSATGVTTRC